MKSYELDILDRLHTVQTRRPDLIPPDVNVYEEYGLSQSFHHGSTSEARSHGVDDCDVDLVNPWRAFIQAHGRRPRLTTDNAGSLFGYLATYSRPQSGLG